MVGAMVKTSINLVFEKILHAKIMKEFAWYALLT